MALQKQQSGHTSHAIRRDSSTHASSGAIAEVDHALHEQLLAAASIAASIPQTQGGAQSPAETDQIRPSSANMNGILNATISLQTADWAAVRETARKSTLGVQNNVVGESLEVLEELSEVSQTLGLSGGAEADLAANLSVEEKLFVTDRLLLAQNKFNEVVAKSMQVDMVTPVFITLGNQIAALQADVGNNKSQQDDLKKMVQELELKLTQQTAYTKSLEKTVTRHVSYCDIPAINNKYSLTYGRS